MPGKLMRVIGLNRKHGLIKMNSHQAKTCNHNITKIRMVIQLIPHIKHHNNKTEEAQHTVVTKKQLAHNTVAHRWVAIKQ
jgi:hypothetical protein